MNGTKYSFIAHWGARAEDVRSCGARLAVMLSELAKVHPVFARWNEKGRNPAEWNRPFCIMPPQVDELAAQFARHQQQRVLDRDRGYFLSAWNGQLDDRGVFFLVFAGDGNRWGSRPFSNSVSLDLHRRSAENADLTDVTAMRAMLLAVVAGWEPDCAEVMDWKQLSNLPPGKHLPHFRSGWMSYLAAPYARKIVPPPQAIAETLPGGGLLMLATREPFDLLNPDHAAAAAAIQLALEPIQSMVEQPRAT
jgi:hypothetical protein